jgi:hypothetical protein
MIGMPFKFVAGLALFYLIMTLQSCWVGDTFCRGMNQVVSSCKEKDKPIAGAAAETFGPSSGIQPEAISSYEVGAPPYQTVVSTQAGSGFALTRLTPEQLSQSLDQALGWNATTYYNAYLGREDDYLQDIFGVSLGGIDFRTTSFRDPATKAQSLLVARVLAWTIAKQVVFHDAFQDPSNPRVFTECDVLSARPGTVDFDRQVGQLFWRLYSRPASAAEIAAVAQAFATTLLNESDWPPAGWITVLYAMLSSQEFWHH